MVKNESGNIVRSKKDIRCGESLKIYPAEGVIEATAK